MYPKSNTTRRGTRGGNHAHDQKSHAQFLVEVVIYPWIHLPHPPFPYSPLIFRSPPRVINTAQLSAPHFFPCHPLIGLIPGPHDSLNPLVNLLCSPNPNVLDPHRWLIPPISTVGFIPFLFFYCLFGRSLDLRSDFVTPLIVLAVGLGSGNPFGKEQREVKNVLLASPLLEILTKSNPNHACICTYPIERILKNLVFSLYLRIEIFETFFFMDLTWFGRDLNRSDARWMCGRRLRVPLGEWCGTVLWTC